MNYREFIKRAAKDPDLLERVVEEFDEVTKELGLDKESVTRLKQLGDVVERIRLNTPHEIGRMAGVLSRGLGDSLSAWTNEYSNGHIDQWTDQYKDDGPEELAEIFGLKRRSILQSMG